MVEKYTLIEAIEIIGRLTLEKGSMVNELKEEVLISMLKKLKEVLK